MLVPLIIAVLALVVLAILQDYRFMTALKRAQPELYQAYGGHTFLPAPRRFRMMTAVLTGRYKSEVTDPRVRALAGQFRAAIFIYFVVLLTGIAVLAWNSAPNA